MLLCLAIIGVNTLLELGEFQHQSFVLLWYYFFIKETPSMSSILFLIFFFHWKPGKQKSKNKLPLIFRQFFQFPKSCA